MRFLLGLGLLGLAGCGAPPAATDPHQIRIVGGAAGYPITTAIAETFMEREANRPAPLVQAGGDGAGIARFCGGLGPRHPDLALVGRDLTPAERRRCTAHGIRHVTAIPIGWSATVVAAAPPPILTAVSGVALRAAVSGPEAAWPGGVPVSIHGTVDMLPGVTPRVDGRWHGHGADAALAADAAIADRRSVAVLPYAAWWPRRGALVAVPLDGVVPDAATIASGRYPARTPLLLLLKPSGADSVPGMAALLRLFADVLRPGGAFGGAGLVPLDAAGRIRARCAILDAAGATPPNCNK